MTRPPIDIAARFRLAMICNVLFSCTMMLTACGSAEAGSTYYGEGAENTGSISLELQLGDVSLETIAYEITGPNNYTRPGTINVKNSQTISAVIGGIPAGDGYLITLSAVATNDPEIQCSASATFSISTGAITKAIIGLQCRLPEGNGTLIIEGTTNVCPRIDAVSVHPAEVPVGGSIALQAQITDTDQLPAPAGYTWTSTAGTLTGETSANATLACTDPGLVIITLDVSDGDCADSVSFTVTCSASEEPPAPVIKANEVESSGGVPGDWVELYNAGATTADVSGWVLKDNDDTHIYTIPAGTIIAPGGYLVIDEAALGFGLGSGDSARLFDASSALVDSFTWTAHAAVTYGRCPDGTGAFVNTASSTKGTANACVPIGPVALPWPGENDVQTVDGVGVFGTNLSGLTYEPATSTAPAVLWAVRNGPGTLYRLVFDGTIWTPDTANDWSVGKAVHYPDGTGNVDSEGVTKAEYASSSIFVATERNNDVNTISRSSVLRFDADAVGSSLNATMDFNLTSDLPAVGANLGLEAITWIPDSYLVSKGFFDELAIHAYDPAAYPDHGTGLFLVGLEGNGIVYAYALDQVSGAFQRIATIPSGHPGVMSLEFDRELGYLWAGCDDTCGNQTAILEIDTNPASTSFGRFYVRQLIDRPSTLPNINNEGIAFAPLAECVGGFRSFFWADDSQTDGHSLRADSIPCGPFL